MKAHLVKIGNSRGIRIPRVLIEEVGLTPSVEMEVENGRLVIGPVRLPRDGWAEQFRAMHEHGDDCLLDAQYGSQTGWDDVEWEW